MKTDAEVQIRLRERHSGCSVEHGNATRCSDARSWQHSVRSDRLVRAIYNGK
jgi:hypothetical protein